MPISVNSLGALRETPQTEQEQAKNISYKANPNNTLNRTLQADTYEKKSAGKALGIIAGVIAAAAIVIGGICYHKGKPAEGETKKFMERLKDGWKELWGKAKKAADDGANGVEDETKKASAEAEAKAKAEISEAYDAVIEKEKKAFDEKVAEAQAKYNKLYESKLGNKSAKDSMEVMEAAFNGNLNYELKVGNDMVIVENGEIKKCINSAGKEWQISNKTNKDYAEKIYREVEKKSDEIIKQNKKVRAEASRRYAEEKSIAEAEQLNKDLTAALNVPTKSAKESAKVFEDAEVERAKARIKAEKQSEADVVRIQQKYADRQKSAFANKSARESAELFTLGEEAEVLQKYCEDKYGKLLRDDIKYIHGDITEFPELPWKQLENGKHVATITNGENVTKYVTRPNETIITSIYHETENVGKVHVHQKGQSLVARTEDEIVALEGIWAKEDGYAIMKNGYYTMTPKSPSVYSYTPVTDKARSQISMSEASSDIDKAHFYIDNGVNSFEIIKNLKNTM